MLGYRSCFSIDVDATPALAKENAISRLLADVFSWLKNKKRIKGIDELEENEVLRTKRGAAVAYSKGTSGGGADYAHLIYKDPPENGHWETSVLITLDTKGKSARVTVLLEVDAAPDVRREESSVWTEVPVFLREWLRTYRCFEGELLLPARPEIVDSRRELDRLIASIENPRRASAVILCSEDGTVDIKVWQDRLGRLTSKTLGQAATFILTEEMARVFNEQASPSLQLREYSPRLFKVNATISDPNGGLLHRAISAKKLLTSRTDVLERMFGRICRDEFRARPVEKSLRRLRTLSSQELSMALDANLGSLEISVDQNRVGQAAGAGRAERSIQCRPSLEGVLERAEESLRESAQAIQRGQATSERLPARDSSGEESGASVRDGVHNAVDQAALFAEISALRNELSAANEKIAFLENSNQQEVESRQIVQAQLEKLKNDYFAYSERVAQESEAHNESMEELKFFQYELQYEIGVVRDELKEARYQLRVAREALRANSINDSATYARVEGYKRQDIDGWEELEELAPVAYPHLMFECNWSEAMALSRKSQGENWLDWIVDILQTLDNYVACKKGEIDVAFNGGLREFLKAESVQGYVHFSPERFRQTESELVKNNRKMADERNFHVSPQVDSSGRRKMFTHIEVQTKGSTSPRIYLEDRVNDLGAVVIGYIGKHLTNSLTN